MSNSATLDEQREHVHGMWAAVAVSWDEHAAYADARGAAVGDQMLELVQLQPGDRVLELACGPAGLGIAAASRVQPGGEVVLSDVVPEMTAIAARRAAAQACTNVRTRILDLEDIDEPDGAYDVVLCREGLMFAVDPAAAAREIARVLRPGGRAAIAVWGPRERNPWLGLVLDAATAQLGRPVPPPGVPGPFALSDAARLHALLADAGLGGVEVSERDVPMHVASAQEWWTRTRALAGPLSNIIAAMPAPAAEALAARAQEAAAAYATTDGIAFPGVTLLAVGRR